MARGDDDAGRFRLAASGGYLELHGGQEGDLGV
jgi:hypothetical protein